MATTRSHCSRFAAQRSSNLASLLATARSLRLDAAAATAAIAVVTSLA